MSKSRDAVIAVTATIFFGVFSRVTVRIPYMVWGYFDESFFISFVWWLLYAGSLYVAIREYMENVDGYFKVILQAGLFGGAAALIKTCVWGDHSRRSCGLYWNDLLLPSENRLGAGTVFRRSSTGWRRTGKAESDNKVCPGIHWRGDAGICSVFYYIVAGTS